MGRYDRAIASAKRLIKKNGQLVNWIKHDVVVGDPTKPWAVSAADPLTPPAPVYIVFLTPKGKLSNELFHLMQGTSVPQGAPTGLMASVAFTPAIDDKVDRDGKILRVKAMDIVAPSGVPILYKLEFA